MSLSINIKRHLFKTQKTLLLLPLPLPRIITGRPEIINLRTGIIFFYEQASLIVSREAALFLSQPGVISILQHKHPYWQH